jgi:hypothetical protein
MPFFSYFFDSKTDNPNFVRQFYLWTKSMSATDVGALFAFMGFGFYLQHHYRRHHRIHKRNVELQIKLTHEENLIQELQKEEAITNLQSSTLYLMQREVLARELEQKRQYPVTPNLKGPLIRENTFPFTPYDPDALPKEAIGTAQQASRNVSNYIKETEAELYSQRERPSCGSNYIKALR